MMATRPADHDPARGRSLDRVDAPLFAALRPLLPAAVILALAAGALWSAPQQPLVGLREAAVSRASAVRERAVEVQRSASDRLLELQRHLVEMHRATRGG
jgi:hypothetical protein